MTEEKKDFPKRKRRSVEYITENDNVIVSDSHSDYDLENTKTPEKSEYLQQQILAGKEPLPPFTIRSKKGARLFENMKVIFHDQENHLFYMNNRTDKIAVTEKSIKTILNPESLYPKEKGFQKAVRADDVPGAVIDETILPEFSLLTPDGIRTYKDMKLTKVNGPEDSYELSNGEINISVTAGTFNEIISQNQFDKTFDDKTPAWEKLLPSQYDMFFKIRENTADNFIHNLSAYSRRESNSPLDALTISRNIISRMDRKEKEKTRELLKQMQKEDQSINQVLIQLYFDAVKEVPLNKNAIINSENKIAKPFHDTLSIKGQRIDPVSSLCIGDKINNIAFNIPKAFGFGKDHVFEDLTVISSSKEGNKIVLMDNRKSFYEVPRDTLLEGYNRQQIKELKKEAKQKSSYGIEIER